MSDNRNFESVRMCPRKNKQENNKRQERDIRQQEKKAREKKAHGKEDTDDKLFREQLRTFNLQLRNIIGDGNCLFRSCEFEQLHFRFFVNFQDFSRRSTRW